jgi:hypothetical protein
VDGRCSRLAILVAHAGKEFGTEILAIGEAAAN